MILRAGTHVAHRRLSGLLHDIAQFAGGGELATAFHHGCFGGENRAADLGPGQTGRGADLILLVEIHVAEFDRTEHVADGRRVDHHGFDRHQREFFFFRFFPTFFHRLAESSGGGAAASSSIFRPSIGRSGGNLFVCGNLRPDHLTRHLTAKISYLALQISAHPLPGYKRDERLQTLVLKEAPAARSRLLSLSCFGTRKRFPISNFSNSV